MKLPHQSNPVTRAAGTGPAFAGGIAPSAPNVKFGCKNNVMIMLVPGVPGGPTILQYPCLDDQNTSSPSISSSARIGH
jgi:hypothetical protein